MTEISKYSTQLFARSSFLEGMARLFDTASALNIYNQSKTEAEADTEAISSDWRAVGEDIKEAMQNYESKR